MANKKRGYHTIKLGGKNRTLHFSMNFWAELTDLLEISLEDVGSVFSKGLSIKAIRSIIYCGLLANDKEEGNEIDYTEYKVGSWLDDLDSSEIEGIVSSMLESRILGNDLNMGINRKVTRSTKKGK